MGDDQHFWESFFPTAFALGERFVPAGPEVEQPNALSAPEIRRWIEGAAKQIRLSPTQWAKKSGLAPSTINRFLKDQGSANLSARTIEALIKSHSEVFISNAVNYELPTFRSTFQINVIGNISQQPRRFFEWDNELDYRIRVPVPHLGVYPVNFAFEAQVDIANLFRSGDVVYGNPASPFRNLLRSGQHYLFHERLQDDTVHTSIRRLAADPQHSLWLVPLSSSDRGRAVFFNDLNEQGFNDRYLVSFLLFGHVACAAWLRWDERWQDQWSDPEP